MSTPFLSHLTFGLGLPFETQSRMTLSRSLTVCVDGTTAKVGGAKLSGFPDGDLIFRLVLLDDREKLSYDTLH